MQKGYKVLHVTPAYFPAFKYGGPVHSVHLLNKALIKLGLEVNVLTTIAGVEDIHENKWVKQENVPVKYFSFFGEDNYSFSLDMLYELLKSVNKYDLVHATSVWNFTTLASAIACFVYKKPLVISPRGSYMSEGVKKKSYLKKWIYNAIISSHYMKGANSIHFTSEVEADANLVDKKKLKDYFIVPNGLDLEKYKNKVPKSNVFIKRFQILEGERYLLFMGRIDLEKGLLELLKAFIILKKQYPDLFLVIAGPDNKGLKKELKDFAFKNDISSNIIFTGLLKGEEKALAYSGAALTVLPSTIVESFGMVILESIICETPVVVSEIAGLANPIIEYSAGEVVEPKPESIAEGIKRILNDSNYASRLTSNANRMLNEQFDIDKVAIKMAKHYEELITKNV